MDPPSHQSRQRQRREMTITETQGVKIKGMCKISNVMFEDDNTKLIILLDVNGSRAKKRSNWQLRLVKKRYNFNRKLKRACVRLRELVDSGAILRGEIGMGGDAPDSLTIVFRNNNGMNQAIYDTMEILGEELD